MSDTTPRHDDTTSDPTGPPVEPTDFDDNDVQHADVEATEVVPSAEEVATFEPHSAGATPQAPPPPAPVSDSVYAAPPAPVPPATQTFDPTGQQQYAQPQYAPQPPAYAQQPPAYGQQPPPPPGNPAPGYAVAPAPMQPSDERTTGMAAHGVALGATVLSGGFLGFVCALVMYLVFRDRGPFVRHHAANALNVQIIAGIVMLVSLPLMLLLVGFLTFGVAFVWAVVMHIIGAIKANNGEWWNPPMTPQFVK